MADKIYLLRGNDTPMAVCLRKREGDGDPVPYDLSAAERIRLALVGHGAHIFATGVTVTGEDSNIVSGVIPGRALLKGDYDLEVTFKSGGRDKRFAVEDMFTAVDFLAEDADGEAEGEGDGISVTVTVQPEVIEIAGPTGPQGHDGKSAYEVWLEDGHTGDEDDFFKWLASEGLPWNDVDISSLTVRNGYITSSGVWNSGSTYCHTLLPVSAGKAVRVTAAESNLFRYAWLTSGRAPRGGIAADLVPGTERTDVAAGSSVSLVVPDGAKYLYVYLGTPADKANTPESMAVSDTIASLRKDTDTNTGDIAILGEEARHSGVYGHFDGAGTSISDGGNIYVVAGMSYRLTMLHPDITVTDPTGNVWRLVVSARDDSGAVVSNLVQVSDVSRLSDHYDLTIPSGATHLYIYGRCAAGQTCDYVLERLDTQTYNDGDILTLNPDSEFLTKWQSAMKPYYTSQSTNKPNCVRFLHISDVHGNWANVRRFLKFYNHWVDKGYDITAINTGDTATDYLTDGVTGYTSIDGVDKILGVVGNHDTRGTSGWQQYKGLEVYNALFAPLISGWGVVQPEGAAENGYCYYYKDYATNKLRLVVVDIMGYDDTEDAWLASVLASAKTAGYHVLIATHFAGGRSSAEASQPPYKKIDCQWSTMAGLASTATQTNGYNPESYKMADTVHAFMEDGGIFCGYMCGHSHLEFVARLDKYPDQMIYTVGSSKSGKVHDYTHTTGTRMQDEFEIVAVDTDSKFVKLYKVGANYDRRGRLKDSICVSYDTHEVVGFPVTTEALAKEMDGKQDRLVSGENIKTINGESILGEGNIQIEGSQSVQSDWNEDDSTDPAYIKNKPTIPTVPTDVVKYTEQELTKAQQEQARTNIAAASESEVSQLRSDVNGFSFRRVDTSAMIWNAGFRKTNDYSIGTSSLWKYSNPFFVKKGSIVCFNNWTASDSISLLGEISADGATFIRTIYHTSETRAWASILIEKDMYIEVVKYATDYADRTFYIYELNANIFLALSASIRQIEPWDVNVFELGNLVAKTTTPPERKNSTSRIRTKIGQTIRFVTGDTISVPSGVQFYLMWYGASGWNSVGWKTSYTIAEDGDYYILGRSNPEGTIADAVVFARNFVVTHYNGKQDQLKDGITIRRINGASILGPGNISILRNDFMRRPIRSIAHRGCHILLNPTRNIPEGSKQAFIQAAKQGFDTIEFDIQYTSDGVPVVFHDVTINDVAMNQDGTEISEQIEVSASTYAELMEYDYGIRYGESYAGTKLLTLQEAVSIAKGLGLDIMPEIKRGFNGDRLREVIDIVSSFDMLDNCIWQALATSVGKANIDIMLDYNDRINVLYLVSGQDISNDNIQIALSAIRDSNKVYIGASYTLLTQVGIGLCKNAGIALVIWTVDSPSYIINDMDSYVCGVISDHTAAQKLLRENLISQAIE